MCSGCLLLFRDSYSEVICTLAGALLGRIIPVLCIWRAPGASIVTAHGMFDLDDIGSVDRLLVNAGQVKVDRKRAQYKLRLLHIPQITQDLSTIWLWTRQISIKSREKNMDFGLPLQELSSCPKHESQTMAVCHSTSTRSWRGSARPTCARHCGARQDSTEQWPEIRVRPPW
jgi:hypothetical protein